MVRHPQNGPSLAPPKDPTRKAAPSPGRRDAAPAEAARDAAKENRTHKDLAGWAIEQLRNAKGSEPISAA